MRYIINPILVTLLSLFTLLAKGQGVPSAVTNNLPSNKINELAGTDTLKVDSTRFGVVHVLDSTNSKMAAFKRSLLQKLDSLNTKGQSSHKLQYQLDSVENRSKQYFHNLDSSAQKISHALDSLQTLRLPTEKYKVRLDSASQRLKHKFSGHKADSASNQIKEKVQGISSVTDSLEAKIKEKEMAMQQAIKKKTGFADSLSLNLKNPLGGKDVNYASDKMDLGLKDNANLPNTNINTPNLNGVPNTDVGSIGAGSKDMNMPKVEMPGGVQNISEDASKLAQMPKEKLSELSSNTELEGVKDGVQKISSATDKIETYSEDIKNITSGNAEKVEALPKELENIVMNRTELKEAAAQIKEAEATKNVLMQYHEAASKMNEEGAKNAAKEFAAKELPDYFAGQEDKLQAGVAKLEKLKKKYGSIPDSRYLPKRVPNDMKGKPLIERIVPGSNFQFFKMAGLTMVDISPFAMYRFTGRLRGGLGATYRMQFNKKVQPVHPHDAYGYRVMADYKVLKGFNVHAEGEWMKMVPYNPLTNVKLNDSEKAESIPAFYLGILKQYKAGRHIEGNFQILYNFLHEHKGVYPTKVNIRFGFEFPMKKKTSKK